MLLKNSCLKRTEVRPLLLKGTVDEWLHVLLRHFDGELHTDYEEEELGEQGSVMKRSCRRV